MKINRHGRDARRWRAALVGIAVVGIAVVGIAVVGCQRRTSRTSRTRPQLRGQRQRRDKADVRRPRGRPKGASSVDYKGVRLARFGTQKEFKQWRNGQSFKLRHMGNNDKRSIWGCMDHHCEGGGPCAYELAAFKDGIGVELWHPVGGAVHSTTPVVLDSAQ